MLKRFRWDTRELTPKSTYRRQNIKYNRSYDCVSSLSALWHEAAQGNT